MKSGKYLTAYVQAVGAHTSVNLFYNAVSRHQEKVADCKASASLISKLGYLGFQSKKSQ